jgi:hypothetical protein
MKGRRGGTRGCVVRRHFVQVAENEGRCFSPLSRDFASVSRACGSEVRKSEAGGSDLRRRLERITFVVIWLHSPKYKLSHHSCVIFLASRNGTCEDLPRIERQAHRQACAWRSN